MLSISSSDALCKRNRALSSGSGPAYGPRGSIESEDHEPEGQSKLRREKGAPPALARADGKEGRCWSLGPDTDLFFSILSHVNTQRAAQSVSYVRIALFLFEPMTRRV